MCALPITHSSYAAPAQAQLILALRNLFLTFALTLIALAAVGYVWKELGYEMLIVAMGWPHVILGFLFYFGRVLHGYGRTRSIFALLALVTLLFWITHYAFAITAVIYVYFLYHAFRDEGFIYQQTRSRHKLQSLEEGGSADAHKTCNLPAPNNSFQPDASIAWLSSLSLQIR